MFQYISRTSKTTKEVIQKDKRKQNKNKKTQIAYLSCNLQYIGETKRRLKDRFNEHRRAVDKTNINLNPLLFLNTFSLTLTILILTCS